MKKSFVMLCMLVGLISSAWAVVDINTATQSELESVKGLGPAKAKAIIEYREKHGAFKSVDDLANVKGLGKASVAKFKGDLNVAETKAAGKAKK